MSENAYLVGLRLTGKKVVVVGGGTVAQRRLPLLIGNGADVHVITRSATPAVEAMDGITLELREFRDGDLDGVWYAIAATDDPDVNAAIVAEADRRQIFCVRADVAREGTAVTPASFEYEGLSVGVLAGGEHRRSAAIRSAIHEALQQGLIAGEAPGVQPGGVALVGGGPGDPELITVRGRRLLAHADVVVAEADRRQIFCVRADVAREGTAVTPASFEYEGLSVGVLAGGEHRRSAAIRSAIHEALQQGLIAGEAPGAAPGGVALVGGGPGDPELITVRGRRLLAHADVVVADRLAPQELLAELAPQVEVIDAAKIPYGRAMAQDAINDVLIDRARAGKFVVRLKGGDPFVFARGYEEVLACAEAGIPVTVVPGVTSAIAVPALAGVPVTHRGVTHEFVVVSGHVAPDHPESLVNWNALAAMSGTIVLLMAVERIEQFSKVLLDGGRPADTPVLVVQHGTTASQRTLRATLTDAPDRIREEGVRPPAIIVIGPVAAFAG